MYIHLARCFTDGYIKVQLGYQTVENMDLVDIITPHF